MNSQCLNDQDQLFIRSCDQEEKEKGDPSKDNQMRSFYFNT